MTNKPIYMDKTISEDLGGIFDGKANQPDMFGVEIELEGRNIVSDLPSISRYWTRHGDGSLRTLKDKSQACEYVLKKPLNFKDTKEALAFLFSYLNMPPVEVFESYRTSIHVHLNFLFETFRTTVNFITLAIILDELLVSQNGDMRPGNNFCLRYKDAEGQIRQLVESINCSSTIWYISNQHRYSSVNIASLSKFGSIEFRSLECTTDFDRVMHWIGTLQAIKEAAREFSNPREIIAAFSRKGSVGFLLNVLGVYSGKYVIVPRAQTMLRDGMRLAQDFAFCSDWVTSTDLPPKASSSPLPSPDMAFYDIATAEEEEEGSDEE